MSQVRGEEGYGPHLHAIRAKCQQSEMQKSNFQTKNVKIQMCGEKKQKEKNDLRRKKKMLPNEIIS